MFDTVHKIIRIREADVVAANRIAACEFGRAFLLLVAGSDFLAGENGKARASNGLRRNGSGSTRILESLAKGSENLLSIFAKQVHYVRYRTQGMRFYDFLSAGLCFGARW